mgnify:CR=1 FL=1
MRSRLKKIVKKKTNVAKKNLTLDDLIKMGKITSKTIDRVNIVKSYIEKKYSLRKQKNDEKNKGKKYLIINI